MLDNSVTIKAQTVEKAVKIGLSKLDITEDQATITVINEGKRGLFGFGKQDAIVEVTANKKISLKDLDFEDLQAETAPKPAPAASKATQAKAKPVHKAEKAEKPARPKAKPSHKPEVATESVGHPVPTHSRTGEELEPAPSLDFVARYLEDVIKAFGADARVSVVESSREVHFNIETDKSGLIIGKHGKIIDALQSLAQVMVHRGNRRRVAVLLNVGDYRDRRAGILENVAERTARQVLRTKQPVILDPLPAFERKQIHSHLSQYEHIKTHSEGSEPNRYLVVEYEN